MLFEKKSSESGFKALTAQEMRRERIYHIVANFVLNNSKKDQVRLFDNAPSALPDVHLKGELEDLNFEESLKTFLEILQISLKNSSVVVTYKDTENQQIYSQRVQEIKYQGNEAVILFVQNVTNVQKLQELEAQDRLTTMYSANVSHEMRTPLSTSINFADLLLSTEKDPLKRKHIEIIKFSSILMLNNVNDTLDHAQI